MLNPANLFRMMTEMIFVLLGCVLIGLGLTNRYMFNPRSPAWLGLGVVLVYWGARAWMKTTRAAERTIEWWRVSAGVAGAGWISDAGPGCCGIPLGPDPCWPSRA